MWDIYGQVCFRELRVECTTPCDPTPYRMTGIDGDLPIPSAAGHLVSIIPNPFNPSTEICFVLNANAQAELAIFDIRGHRVATLVNDMLAADTYTYAWNGLDAADRQVANGVYFARLQIGDDLIQVKKLALIK